MEENILIIFMKSYLNLWLTLVLNSVWKWKTEVTIPINGKWIVIISLLAVVKVVSHFHKKNKVK
jgi:hypothetical protein